MGQRPGATAARRIPQPVHSSFDRVDCVKVDPSINFCVPVRLSLDLCDHRLHTPSDQGVHEGKRLGRSIQSRVGRRDGPHAYRRAKSVAVAREAALYGDVATPLVPFGAVS